MKYLLGVLAVLLLTAPPLAAQTALCPADYTATGGGYYRVVVDGASVSQHTRLDQAIERANAEETAAPALDVTVVHDYQLRVECDEDWVLPTGAPDRVTTLTVIDSTATSFRIAWLEVDDGTGQPADYEVRIREVGDSTHWLHPLLVVLDGSCGFPVLGQALGDDVVCEITGLDPDTDYEAVVRAFRDENP